MEKEDQIEACWDELADFMRWEEQDKIEEIEVCYEQRSEE